MVYDQKPWLKSYDAHVSPEITVTDKSLVQRLAGIRRDFPNKPAVHFLGVTLTYEQIMALGDRFANALAAQGLGKGDVVAINLPNLPQYFVAIIGAHRAGCAVSGLSPLLTPDEMAYQINDCGAKVLVTLDPIFQHRVVGIASKVPNLKMVVPTGITDFLPVIKQLLAKWLKKVPTGQISPLPGKTVITFKDLLKKHPPKPPQAEVGPEDTCFIQYTGGTTGPPKGAELTHANIIANMTQLDMWLDSKRGQEFMISGFPLFHIAGLMVGTMCLATGHTQVLIPDPRNTKHIVKEFKQYRPTLTTNVPSLYMMLLAEPEFRTLDFSGLKACVSGAAPFSVDSIKALEEVVGKGKLLEVFGMTETSPLQTMNPFKNSSRIGSVGLPLPSTAIRIVDLADSETQVPLNQEGEIICSGPQVMRGYHHKPEETANALREHDGRIWMHTGDIGRMDEDGFVYIVDRAKDMISVSGFKVFSTEVENILYEHPAIEMCAIIGLVNPERPETELVKLVVQKAAAYKDKPDDEVRADILALAKEKLAAYKVPKIVEFTDAIPLTAVGKVDKKILRKQQK
jgi:acyl-CoA synthetase (AMP-forming)/AMP-acid ligase II